MNTATFNEIRSEVRIALEKRGLAVDLGAFRFDENQVKFGVTATLTSTPNGESLDSKRTNWNKYCETLGFKKSDFGRKFVNKLVTFTITEIKLNRYKYPIVASDVDGKRFKFTAEQIKRYFDLTNKKVK